MKKAIMIGLPVVLLAVGAGLVMTGVVKIPGMGGKAKARSAQLYEEGKDPKVADKKAPPAAAETPKKAVVPPKVDAKVVVENQPELGQKKLAKLWNEIETPALKDLTKDWKDAELAPVLMRMDSAKVAELLSTLEPKKASSLSRELQRQASVVARETAS